VRGALTASSSCSGEAAHSSSRCGSSSSRRSGIQAWTPAASGKQ
jgi:hypothetical protein